MANNSLNLVPLDFATLRNQLKTYMSSQDIFADYDFNASNIAVLIDLLAYNTFQNAYYINMLGSEMFLDSAQLRDSIISHAKELGYVPRSNKSAVAYVDILVTTGGAANFVIPKNTPFNARVGSNNYTFTTNTAITVSTVSNTAVAANVALYEGTVINDVFTFSAGNTFQRFVLTDPNVDISSLYVNVIENSGANLYNYQVASSLFGIDALSQVYFIEPAADGKYEIKFGDGVLGRTPKNGAVISVEYRKCNGDLPNGVSIFSPSTTIGGFSNITINTRQSAAAGQYAEGLESIRFNAPRHYATQERAVTAEDYEILLMKQFPEISSISVYGGEELDPPQYGRVFITPNISNLTGLPQGKKEQYLSYIKTRSPLTIEPVFSEPEYLFVRIDSIVNYNLNLTANDPDFIRTLVTNAILNFNTTNLADFKSTLRYSKLIEAMDDADTSIVGNDTDLQIYKFIEFVPNVTKNYNVKLDTQLISNLPELQSNHPAAEKHAISSSSFTYAGRLCQLEDNGQGILRIVADDKTVHSTIIDVGTVDYTTGEINLVNFGNVTADGNKIKIYGIPASKDIASKKNVILTIQREDIGITVNQIRE